MTEWPSFENAPITEALLDIRANLPPEITFDRLAAFHEGVQDTYPDRKERFVWTGQFQPDRGFEGSAPTADGFLFFSVDKRQILQARLDGFTFNRLKPYDRWTSFRDSAHEQWNRYCDAARPLTVTRVALRYINRIEIPLPFQDLKEYVLTVPEIAPKLPQGLAGFLMRLTVPFERFSSLAIVTETIEEIKEEKLPLIFDIDVFREGTFEPRGNEIWNLFEELRTMKNEVFFNSVTEKAQELFR